jgi:hypothetical protein
MDKLSVYSRRSIIAFVGRTVLRDIAPAAKFVAAFLLRKMNLQAKGKNCNNTLASSA